MTASDLPTRANEVRRPFWMDLLACPRCGEDMAETNGCDHCGLTFAREDGLLCMKSANLKREVRFPFSAARSAPARDYVQRVVRDPPVAKDAGETPYHVDAAHVAVINKLKQGSRVLEIGCGGGQCRGWFERKGMSYVGVDLCRTRVFDWLQKYGGPDLLCDCHFLPFRSMQFDLVYCAALFEHVACPVLVMMEVARVLKQGGYFLGNCAFLEPWHDSSFCHMSPLAAIEALTAAGLDVDYVWPGRGYHAFRSIPAMCYLGPLKLLAHLGWIPYGLYWLQSRARAVARRLLSRDGVPDVFDRAVVSGATDWIAHRPVAYHCSALAP